MTDENKLHEIVAQGVRAAQERDELKGAFEQLKADYYAAWANSSADDTQGRERLFLAVSIIGKVEEHLRQVADGGKMAARELEEILQRAAQAA